jgi:uncharacterized protein (TIGR03437 family)
MGYRTISLYGLMVLAVSSASAQNAVFVDNGGTVAPGSLISIFGSSLAAGLSVANSIPASTTLSDVTSVTINGQAAPLLSVSGGQINVQVPWEASPGSANVVVNRTGGSSQPLAIQVSQYAPMAVVLNPGALQAFANNADGTLVAITGSLGGVGAHAATAGDTISLYATGLGPVNQPPIDGANSADAPRQCVTPPTVTIGGMQANISFAGLSQQLIGVYEIDLTVPGGAGTGSAIPIQIQTADGTNANPVTIALQ